ncbi:hypothetical protein R50072_28110 [Simiduia litorea]
MVHKPQPKHVTGQWESLSVFQLFPYALLDFQADGTGTIIISTYDNKTILTKLNSFKSNDVSFEITLTDLEDEGSDSEIYIGSLRRGQLCFTEKEDNIDSVFVCFTRVDDIESLRSMAKNRLSEYRNQGE